jgi:hypothetical protein
MSYNAVVYNIMIASPGDMEPERAIIREVIVRWNYAHAETRCIILMPVGWDTHSSPAMGARPQSILNGQILEGADLLIGVFWTRIGTASGEYPSGSVEEIEEHIKAGKPAMLYFSSAPVVYGSVDRDQYDQLMEFKQSCQSRGIYEEFDSTSEFRRKFDQHLQIKINQDKRFLGFSRGPTDQGHVQEALPPQAALSKEAQALLKAAQQDGQILHIKYLAGTAIQSGGSNFVEETARSEAIWEGALIELESEGLVRTNDLKREVFLVTREGYDVLEKIGT